MSTDKLDEMLKRLLFEKAFMRHYTNGAHLLERFDTGHYRSEEARAAWQIACGFADALAAHEAAAQPAEQPRLTVQLRSFPESNGKRNWTALLVRTEKWGGLIGNCGGVSLAHGEYWNRVAYEAERAKLLIGERDTEPHILDYGNDIKTPEEWAGEVRGGRPVVNPATRRPQAMCSTSSGSHRFMHFGDQPVRRCADCNVVETPDKQTASVQGNQP